MRPQCVAEVCEGEPRRAGVSKSNNASRRIGSARSGGSVLRTVVAHVGGGVGGLWRSQQREREHGALHRMPVLAVIEQRHPEAVLRQIGPALRTDLEPRDVP